MKDKSDSDLKRLLRILQIGGQVRMVPQTGQGAVVLQSRRGEFRFRDTVLQKGFHRGLIATSADMLMITPEAGAFLKRGSAADFAAQHIHAEPATVRMPDGALVQTTVNAHESPLARLYLRKARSGRSYISDSQFASGERLRSDFEKANLRARMSIDWDREFSAKSAGSAAGDISDMAVDARKRLNRALDCLEESLRGVVLDICCFLKGLEEVERERQWPPRSAKLMLRTALSILSKHYGLAERSRPGRGTIRHWGDGSHRPVL